MNGKKTYSVSQLSNSHLSTRVEWMNTPDIYEMMDLDLPISLESTQKWFEHHQGNKRRCDFCLIETSSNTIVGMCGLTDIHERDKRAELYIFINPDRRGQGIGMLLGKWLCCYGFLRLNLHKVYLSTLDDNKTAFSLYERVGFIHEGTKRLHQFQFGKYCDKKYYGLLREDWLGQDYSTMEFFKQFNYV